jgi:hypothetical protein
MELVMNHYCGFQYLYFSFTICEHNGKDFTGCRRPFETITSVMVPNGRRQLRRKVAAPEGAPTGSGLLRILVEKWGKCPVRTSSSTIYIGFCAHNTCAKRSLIARPFWANSASAARPFAHVRLSILVSCVRLSSDRNAASSTSSLTVHSVICLGRVVTCESMMRVSDVCVGVSVGVWTPCVPRCAPGC